MYLMSRITLILLTLAVYTLVQCGETEESDDDNIFVPTNEWQVVQKGQKIPKGLHVRVNFETGVTEAKILDDEEKEVMSKNTQVLEIPQDIENNKLIDTEVLKDALKKIQEDDVKNPEEIKNVKDQFRSYEQLKEEMSHLNLTPKIDAEVLQDLFKQHKEELEKEKLDPFTLSRVLEDFDFLAHQIDNGVEFVKQNGFQEVIYNNLNVTNDRVKEETLKLLGSLLQNNPKVQIHALETGAINVLLKIITLDDSIQVKSRAVYALSCMLRRFPLAQLRFVENGGLTVVTKLFEKDSFKIQLKLVTLMNDLIVENVHAKDYKHNEAEMQYRLIKLEQLLLEQNWCDNLNKLLMGLVASDPNDHDALEKCLISMRTVANHCARFYDRDILITLRTRYKVLTESEKSRQDEYSNLTYYQEMYSTVNEILKIKDVKTEL